MGIIITNAAPEKPISAKLQARQRVVHLFYQFFSQPLVASGEPSVYTVAQWV
ncbi:MAG: hypothetical protein RID59_13480 [Hoeflea sp.]